MSFEFEKKKLKSYLGVDLYNDLKNTKAIISGGMITSLFTKTKINDVDIYFRNNADLFAFAEDNIGHVVSHTNKATQWAMGELIIQVIKFKYFDKPEDIFETFDFTVCMGAFDFNTEEFVLHPNFLKHNSQRLIQFNSKTSYPIISALRLQKYQEKGYYVSKSEFARVIMTCMSLNIKSYAELKEQLGGMYGENYDRLIENLPEEEFSLSNVVEKLSDLSISDDYFSEYKAMNYDVSVILDELDQSERLLYQFKGGVYRMIGDKFKVIYNYDKEKLSDINGLFTDTKFYKFVKKEDDKYFSFYDRTFEYIVGEEVKAKEEFRKDFSLKRGALFFNFYDKLKLSPYFNSEKAVLIEVSIEPGDVIEPSRREITSTKCKVIREVPKEEWEQWI